MTHWSVRFAIRIQCVGMGSAIVQHRHLAAVPKRRVVTSIHSSVAADSVFPGISFATKTRTVRMDRMRRTATRPAVPKKRSSATTARVCPDPVCVTVAGSVRTAVTRPAATRASPAMKRVSDVRVASACHSIHFVMR